MVVQLIYQGQKMDSDVDLPWYRRSTFGNVLHNKMQGKQSQWPVHCGHYGLKNHGNRQCHVTTNVVPPSFNFVVAADCLDDAVNDVGYVVQNSHHHCNVGQKLFVPRLTQAGG